ncbi:hypothetical protein V1520DRAFT_357987, partial [Lipomyces starkeyi]
MYISAFMGFLGFALVVVLYPETYAPAVLVSKAATLRRQTRNWGIHAKQVEVEPIVLLVTLYMSFTYGLMYALLGVYPIVFGEVHGMNLGVGGLPFIGLIIGEAISDIYILTLQTGYFKKLSANHRHLIPEWRLPPVVVGGAFFSAGMFWFGWTGFRSSIHWRARPPLDWSDDEVENNGNDDSEQFRDAEEPVQHRRLRALLPVTSAGLERVHIALSLSRVFNLPPSQLFDTVQVRCADWRTAFNSKGVESVPFLMSKTTFCLSD